MMSRNNRAVHNAVLGGLLVGGCLLTGCSSPEPKPMAQPSVQDVRSNADRAFDKLKQEEDRRGSMGAPSR